MRRHPSVVPLEAGWQARLEGIARGRGWPVSSAAVGRGAASLSESYNVAGRAPAALDAEQQAARLLFFFPRDVAKAAAAVRDLPLPAHRPTRILDLGAGLGATALGVLRAWGGPPAVIRAVETDREAAAILPSVLAGIGRVEVVGRPLGEALEGEWDAILFGQVLCELDGWLAAPERVAAHAALLARARALLSPDGAVVVVEPALRIGTRHLQAVRDAVVAAWMSPFAPCLHDAPCPMLPRPGDWCHEWIDCPLPDWVEPAAAAAGLRTGGLTLSRLILRADDSRPPGSLRATSDVLVSKGRSDLWACGVFPEGPAWKKVGRQDRHANAVNAGFDDVHRGDRLDLEPLEPKIGPETVIKVLP